MAKITLDMETLKTIPERTHRMSNEDARKVAEYFQEEFGEEITNLEGFTCESAAELMGDDYAEETLQHIIKAIFGDKYEPEY